MEEIVGWLLQDDNPSVKYFTRKDILGEKLSKNEAEALNKEILASEPVKSILGLQNSQGWWYEDNFTFNPLYKNTFWQLYFLSQLGINNSNKDVDKAVHLIIKHMQNDKGSFPSVGRYTGNLPCMQGITLEMLLRLGYTNEDFMKKAIGFLTDFVFRTDYRCKYRQNFKCPWGTVKILKAFNLILPDKRDEMVTSASNRAIKFLLSHNIVEAKYPRKKPKSNQWFLFGFPRGCQSDILELTSALVDAGCNKNASNIKAALKYISAKRQKDGTWKMEFTLNGRMLTDIEKKNKSSKWITFFALKTLLKSGYIKT
jgi:hypothetical protein